MDGVLFPFDLHSLIDWQFAGSGGIVCTMDRFGGSCGFVVLSLYLHCVYSGVLLKPMIPPNGVARFKYILTNGIAEWQARENFFFEFSLAHNNTSFVGYVTSYRSKSCASDMGWMAAPNAEYRMVHMDQDLCMILRVVAAQFAASATRNGWPCSGTMTFRYVRGAGKRVPCATKMPPLTGF
jgi:hypothetical protein